MSTSRSMPYNNQFRSRKNGTWSLIDVELSTQKSTLNVPRISYSTFPSSVVGTISSQIKVWINSRNRYVDGALSRKNQPRRNSDGNPASTSLPSCDNFFIITYSYGELCACYHDRLLTDLVAMSLHGCYRSWLPDIC